MEEACRVWLSGSLLGVPVVTMIGGEARIHVYGMHKRSYTEVWVSFSDDLIVVVKPAPALS